MTTAIEIEAPVTDRKKEKKIKPDSSIEIKNITVSFKTPKGVYTAVKDISINIKKYRDIYICI